jgi:glycosyltransferase involved in cell wall biosynthesis
MRILYSHRVQSHDGQSVHIEELIAAFRQVGHEVFVVGPGFYDRAAFGGESRFVAMVRRILPGAVSEFAEILYNFPAFLRLRRAVKSFSPDVIYERYNLYHLPGMLVKLSCKIPFYLEVNSPLAQERAQYGDLRFSLLAKWVEKLVWRAADRIFVVSGPLKEIVKTSGIDPDRITVIPNGVDKAAFPSAPYRATPGMVVTIGFIGFIRHWHRLDVLIAGLAAHRAKLPVRLLIVGDGPARSELEQQAEALGLTDAVCFVGLQNRANIPDIIRTFDIAVQPSAVSYASPLKLFEYMACGRAIVAPRQPNICEILSDGENAILFDVDRPDGLWEAVARLVNDGQLREQLGRNARRLLEERDYTWHGNAIRITAAIAADGAAASGTNLDPSLDRSAPLGSEP